MTGDRPGEMSRRRVASMLTAAVGATTLAGCAALWDQPGAADVVVYNAALGPKTVSVTITAVSAEEPHTSRTLDLESGQKVDPINRSKLPMSADYTVSVSVSDGPRETFEWADTDVSLAPLYVLVDETQNIKFLLQAG